MKYAVKYVMESQNGRVWGPLKTAARADRWAKANLRDDGKCLNAYKIRPLHRAR